MTNQAVLANQLNRVLFFFYRLLAAHEFYNNSNIVCYSVIMCLFLLYDLCFVCSDINDVVSVKMASDSHEED